MTRGLFYALLVLDKATGLRDVFLVEAYSREEAVQRWAWGFAEPGWGHRPADNIILID